MYLKNNKEKSLKQSPKGTHICICYMDDTNKNYLKLRRSMVYTVTLQGIVK